MLDFVRNWARKFAVYQDTRALYRRFRPTAPRHPLQRTKTPHQYPLKRLGSHYGGWTFVEDPKLHGATIISAGLGEDASFDIEFARAYGARVVLVDPTPRAILHFDRIMKRLGNPQTKKYTRGGRQSVEAYDLRGLSSSNFVLVPKALWNCRTSLKFFAPADPAHVSHSINSAQSMRHIEVEAITTNDLLEQFRLAGDDLQLIKLDIEGAEVEVIEDFLNRGIRPRQILVELNDLNLPEGPLHRVDKLDRKLRECGYHCIYSDGEADVLYVRKDQTPGYAGIEPPT